MKARRALRASVVLLLVARSGAFVAPSPALWNINPSRTISSPSPTLGGLASGQGLLARGRAPRAVSQGLSMSGRPKITVEDVLKSPKWPEKWPFTAADFKRMDETDDEIFYDSPRLVYHIDEGAVAALTDYYAKNIKPKSDILDICSSWVSHFPADFTQTMGRRAGLGMNGAELKQNAQLTEYTVQNLNKNPKFPYEDNSFDVVTCVVSIDYLNKPLEIFSEVRRVLRPGGKFIISQSNRCFATKAIAIWLNTNDLEHVFIIGSYFHFAGGFKPARAVDISRAKNTPKNPFGPAIGDPMYIIEGEKA